MKLPLRMILVAFTVTFVAARTEPKGRETRNPRRLISKGSDGKSPSGPDSDGKGSGNKNPSDPSKGRDPSRPGSSYCTYSPDYTCYHMGWPSCCNGPNGSAGCPPNPPPCDITTPSPTPPKKTKSPTPSPTKQKSRKGTPSPTYQKSKGKKTKSPTRRPTRRPNSSPTTRCVPDDRPRPTRDGQRFRFNLVKSNAQCVDGDGQLYEYGQFDDVDNFSDCADACVNDVRSDLIDSGSFRGIDFDCRYSECRCLYDQGTLDRRNSGEFDRTERYQYGYGSIEGAKRTRSSRDIYCGKLVGAAYMEADEFLVADVTELWDMDGFN